MSIRLFASFFALLFACNLTLPSYAEHTQEIQRSELPTPPIPLDNAFVENVGGTYIIAGGIQEDGAPSVAVYSLAPGSDSWRKIGELDQARSDGGTAVSGNSLLLVGGKTNGQATASVTTLTPSLESFTTTQLPDLPQALANPAAAVTGNVLYVAGGSSNGDASGSAKTLYALDLGEPGASWRELESWQGAARRSAFLVKSVERLSLIGGIETSGESAYSLPSYHTRYGWTERQSKAPEGIVTSAAKLGDAHAVVMVSQGQEGVTAYLYHMVGDTWTPISEQLSNLPSDSRVVSGGNGFAVLSSRSAFQIAFGEPDTNYGWWDHLTIALYFLGMIYIGFHFSKQSVDSENYFRGGHKIPWWATGMSLFATGASAMSLMAMPGKSYSSNWTFFAISIYSVLALPISMFFFAPIIRKLNFGTAFEYLEKRFGLSVRIIGSTIFAVYQILGRMGGVLLLPSFALEAIAGIPMQVSVPAMGLVTIAYTYLGGLSAVIWTDTIQGLVMIAAVAGCLILVFFRIDMPFSEIWTTLDAQNKLHVFDWGLSLTEENVFTVFIGIVAVTMLGIGDQNFVQRVQCSSSLSATRKAIATQMGVAVPINILLFALGTALFLFYKQSPEALNPVMKNDGIYPFFAAQQLPPGVSGLVIAALLAATMSTISSSICSVSNLAVDDFYKRFSKNPTEKKSVSVGRVVTLLVGLFGIASAFYLDSFETPSIWDLALRVISIVTATTVGIYFLGLFTKRANEIGTLAGIAAGMAITYWVSVEGLLIFWLYPVAGSLVTVVVGYAVSLATGGNQKDIHGLTLATIRDRTGGLDD